MLIMVTGGRDYDDWETVARILDRLVRNPDIDYICIIQGGARGADRLALEWAVANDIECLTFKADWDAFGKRAGHIRNGQMLDFGPPDFVVAFPGGAGTADAIRQAETRGIRVVRVSNEQD